MKVYGLCYTYKRKLTKAEVEKRWRLEEGHYSVKRYATWTKEQFGERPEHLVKAGTGPQRRPGSKW
jgi:hypothetical protein